MKVRLENIPEEGLSVSFEVDRDWLNEVLSNPREVNLHFDQNASSEMTLTLEAGELRIRGRAHATYKNVCALCLAPIEPSVDSEFHVTKSLGPGPAPAVGRGEAEDEDLPNDPEEDHLEGDEMDLDEVVAEQIALLLPFKVVCQEDCKGLCPRCGANLNEGACPCPRETSNSPFAVLGNLKIS